ncbi:hypothetical protein ACJMK2_013414 [Sinanodonta woodiana]|uniref:Peptidase M12B domain-containing protein n=1 Tax=Sinanodonta woodiana TaxID=1069815 RepID=A0ABD3UXG6_SINWO
MFEDNYGNIRIADNSYNLRPMESDVNVLDVPDLHGKRYLLEDTLSMRKENSDEKKEQENVEETRVEEEGIDRHRGLFGHSSMFSYPDISALNNIREISDNEYSDGDDKEGKTRQLKKKYYVDVAVMTDSSIWDLYASRVRITNMEKKRDKVKAIIREAYSHIMNGVNLLYKGIQDTSISIKVTVSTFLFWQRQSLFPHKRSQVRIVNGSTYISAYLYLDDLANWDKNPDAEVRPSFDHVMLFTRHDMYTFSVANNTIGGISHDGGVCDTGDRTSVVQTDDYVRTVSAAAHELGHNLGAFHDGEKDAVDCDPRDFFIMTPIVLLNHPGMNYNINRWLFSNCSQESFKKTLKDKQCVKTKGTIYNEKEWKVFTLKQPGEVYTPDDQCYLINGPRSMHVKVSKPCMYMRNR